MWNCFPGQTCVIIGVLGRYVQIGWSHGLMMGGGVVFGEIVCPIAVAGSPKNVKMTLSYSVTDPIEAHVDGFGSFLLYGVIGNATGCAVVSL